MTRVLEPGESGGWLARRDRVPLGYLGDEEKTARTFPVIDGVRWSVPGDRADLLSDGRIALLGRESVTINTGGEKVFAEEVERALAAHLAVRDVIVVGRPLARGGGARWSPWSRRCRCRCHRRRPGRDLCRARGSLQAAQGRRTCREGPAVAVGQG